MFDATASQHRETPMEIADDYRDTSGLFYVLDHFLVLEHFLVLGAFVQRYQSATEGAKPKWLLATALTSPR